MLNIEKTPDLQKKVTEYTIYYSKKIC